MPVVAVLINNQSTHVICHIRRELHFRSYVIGPMYLHHASHNASREMTTGCDPRRSLWLITGTVRL